MHTHNNGLVAIYSASGRSTRPEATFEFLKLLSYQSKSFKDCDRDHMHEQTMGASIPMLVQSSPFENKVGRF